ncbi:BppU family phage baseplate upper protein [Pediococcus acidilactici]|mgnify:CR=1 FL=1|uniref:BppU family phage baseplate upper protein n=1 Tax=Pediococcus acidilactici TaxID=1254 RepID=UPI00189A68BA|nr:BppU family phage baseplate upper protein [Pediococcus acidilactici]
MSMYLKFRIGKDKRKLVPINGFELNDADSNNPQWIQGRQNEDGGRQVFVDLEDEDGSPVNLTGANAIFKGVLPGGEYKIWDHKHSTIIDAQAGRFRYTFPKRAMAIAGSYKQAFFEVYREGSKLATLEFNFEVLADLVEENIIPSDYITPFEDLYGKLKDYIVKANGDFDAAMAQWKKDVADLITNLNTDVSGINLTITEIKTQLSALEDKIKADGLLTIDEFNKFKNQIMLDVTNRVSKLEKIVDRNYLTYKTISSTLYSIGDGISDDNINAILRVGGTLAMPIMVTVTSSTDPNIVMQSDDRVQQNIDHIKGKGLDITMLKPHIGLVGGYDGLNRATYMPSDFGVFFKNWKDVMLHYAETCNKNGIPILCIGCEQEKCTDPKYITNWIDIYQSIKAKYPNLLITYAMEGNEAKDIDGHGQIAQAVDLVGINAYPNYINKNYDDSVTQDELIAGWYFEQDGNRYMDMFDNYVEKYGKPIFVTETGSMPWKDGLARLLSLQEGDQDFSGQAAAYQATFEAFSQNPNIIGVSIWNTNAPFNFTSPNKTTESELVLKKYFKGGLI